MNVSSGAAMAMTATARVPGRVSIALPYANGLAARMMRIYVYMLFLIPGGLLDLIGYDYTSIGGAQITKIHPATYFLMILAVVFVATYPRRPELILFYLSERLGAILFFVVTGVAMANIVLAQRNGFGMYFDTDLHFFLCSMILPFINPPGMARLERFLHVFFAANAALAVVEIATGWHAFPLMTYSPEGYATLETRPSAFLSHPLHAASLTCAYIVSLLAGAGRFSKPWMRPAILCLQYPTMLAFGGRAAFTLTTAGIGALLLWKLVRFSVGAQVPYSRIILALFALPVAVIGLSLADAAGLSNQMFERFADDGGSARSRFMMAPLLLSFNWDVLLWGGDPAFIGSEIWHFGLEWGIENPFMHLAVLQGVVIAVAILSGLAFAIYDVYRSLQRGAIFPIAAFFFLCSGYGSFGGRFLSLSTFTVIISVLFRANDD
jgi:hypothetical protein